MIIKFFVTFILMLFFNLALVAQDSLNVLSLIDRTPEWANKVIANSDLIKGYEILEKTNPFYFEADFNGDELIDIAFLIKNKMGGKQGVLIINSGSNKAFILGAGKDMGMGSDITWCHNWFVYRKNHVYNFAKNKKTKVLLKNPALEIVKKEDTSLILYWKKSSYKSLIKYQ